MRRIAILTSLTVLLATSVGATAASAKPAYGVADNSAAIFTDPLYALLKSKFTRKIVPIDTIRKGGADLASLDAYMGTAKAKGVEVLVVFNPSSAHGPEDFGTTRDLPSVKSFTADFLAFKKRYPSQKLYSPWNELNSTSQPTYKDPKNAAAYANAVHKNCKTCKIVAGDFLDTSNMEKYYTKYAKALNFTPKIWGLHNYGDSNRNKSTSTKKFLKITKKGEVWFTETGGEVKLEPQFPYDTARAAKAIAQTIKLSKLDKRIKRVYFYSFFGVPQTERFDAGIVEPGTGKPRPGYCVISKTTNPANPLCP